MPLAVAGGIFVLKERNNGLLDIQRSKHKSGAGSDRIHA